jgi:uracil-DNA glycosylase
MKAPPNILPTVPSTASKTAACRELVAKRKACIECGTALKNPSACCDGRYDSDEIGPWSVWQGNLDAEVIIVGQDWGDVAYFEEHKGRDHPDNPTNTKLIELLRIIGIDIGTGSEQGRRGAVFLTNAILCLKQGGLQGMVQDKWFGNCGRLFLKPLIEWIRPKVLITLGERAYRTIEKCYSLPNRRFRDAVESPATLPPLLCGARLFPVYHCGRRILNTHRNPEQQKADWERMHRILGMGKGR